MYFIFIVVLLTSENKVIFKYVFYFYRKVSIKINQYTDEKYLYKILEMSYSKCSAVIYFLQA
tara:strand:+ start:5469 stop:5654 length:186 start_codon:yes stop_codon:yes gene_type:complete